MAEGLKPCPFCGFSFSYSLFLSASHPYAIYCPVCGVSGPIGQNKEEAIAKWNRLKADELVEDDLK